MSKNLRVDAVIAASGSTSGEVKVPPGYDLAGIFTPVCTGTAITMTAASASGGTFIAVKNAANAAISHTVDGTAHYMALDPALYQGLEFLKLVSNGTEAAERTFTLIFRKR